MAKKIVLASTPPSLPTPQAIDILKRQVERANKILALPKVGPDQTDPWENATRAYLIKAFGSASHNIDDVMNIRNHRGSLFSPSQEEYEKACAADLNAQIHMLESCIDQLQSDLDQEHPQHPASVPVPTSAPAPVRSGEREALLEEVLIEFCNYGNYFTFTAFEIKHQDKYNALHSLLRDGTLSVEGGKLRFPFTKYRQSPYWGPDENRLERMLPVLKELYSTQPEGMKSMESLRGLMTKRGAALGMEPVDFRRSIRLFQMMGLVGTITETSTENGREVIDTFQLTSLIFGTKSIAEKLRADEAQEQSDLMGETHIPPPQTSSRPADESTPGLGRWEVIKALGKGGQGAVSLVWDAENLPKTLTNIQEAVAILASAQPPDTKRISARQLAEAVAVFGSGRDHSSLGALKKLHNADTDAKALKRMQSELRALRQINHQHVVRLYDEKLEEGWYVMEYFPGGMLADHRDEFRGNVTRTLAAFRNLVDAMKHLHDANLVHRDIKPENIYVRGNGQLVVGDLGLVFFNDGDTRVTATYENVGSRDWMPTWASGQRQETVTKAFDVFGLGKVLWAMLSGKTRLNLWYFTQPEYDLTKLFPEQPEMVLVNKLLSKCIVEKEKDCLVDAAALLTEIDALQDVVRRGAQHFNPKALRPCRVCDQGQYQRFDRDASYLGLNKTTDGSEFKVFTCNHCGHVDLFRFPEKNNPPPGWKAQSPD